MYRIKNASSGELRNVSSLNGYDQDPEWEQVGPEMPEGVDPNELVLGEGQWVADLPLLRAQRWALVRRARDAAQQSGCPTLLGRVDTDPDSQRKISGAVQMALIAQALGQPFGIAWTMQDNAVVQHDAAAMIALGVAVGQHIEACHAEGTVRRALLDAAQEVAAIQSVPVDGGWPGA